MFKRKKVNSKIESIEYLILEKRLTQQELNALGKLGWNLVSAHSVIVGKNGRIYEYILKRRIL